MKTHPVSGGRCRVVVLGSTGSIGTQTLDVIEHLNGLNARDRAGRQFELVGLAAGRNVSLLGEQARRFGVRELAVADDRETLKGARTGEDAALRLVREVECDLVVAAMSGAAGLPATLASVEAGRDVALANKETLVAAGAMIVPAAQRSGARLLPVDSEHSGVWQAIAGRHEDGAPPLRLGAEVARVILTASGGPFRTWSARDTYHATPEQALKHPTWSMGRKVTVDSASLMNKALELIEAHWLFGLEPARLGVLVHPQSIVHAIVEFTDGSSIAQLGAPDMRTPIQFALTFPGRVPGIARTIDWRELRAMEFEPPDAARFPALELAGRAIEEGGTAGAILNAANEAAVEAFLAGAVPFGRITELVRLAMDSLDGSPLGSLGDALDAATRARGFVREQLGTAAR